MSDNPFDPNDKANYDAYQWFLWMMNNKSSKPSQYTSMYQTIRPDKSYPTIIKGGNRASQVRDPNVYNRKFGDIIGSGPQTVDNSTPTLRANYQLAGYDDVKQSDIGDQQSNAIFETFSWVPDGYGLGPSNRIHQLNKQHDFIRYGTERLYQPRKFSPANYPHGNQSRWQDDLPLSTINTSFDRLIKNKHSAEVVKSITRANPLIVHEGDEWDMSPSTKGLPRRKIQATRPVISIQNKMYNRDQKCSYKETPIPREMKLGTWSHVS